MFSPMGGAGAPWQKRMDIAGKCISTPKPAKLSGWTEGRAEEQLKIATRFPQTAKICRGNLEIACWASPIKNIYFLSMYSVLVQPDCETIQIEIGIEAISFYGSKPMTRIINTLFVGAFLAIIASSSVWAQGAGRGVIGTDCKADIQKYCSNVPHVAGAVPACLNNNRAKLSEACRKALANTGPGNRGMGLGRWGRWG